MMGMYQTVRIEYRDVPIDLEASFDGTRYGFDRVAGELLPEKRHFAFVWSNAKEGGIMRYFVRFWWMKIE